MGNAHFHKGDFALASEDYRSAVELAQASHNCALLEEAHLGTQSYRSFPQARYREAVEMARKTYASPVRPSWLFVPNLYGAPAWP